MGSPLVSSPWNAIQTCLVAAGQATFFGRDALFCNGCLQPNRVGPNKAQARLAPPLHGRRPPMRCSYDAARLSDNVRQIECWFSQLDVGQEALLKRPPMSAPVLVNRVHQGRQAARAGSKDRETLGGAA